MLGGVPPSALVGSLPPPIRDLGCRPTEPRQYDRLPEGHWFGAGDPVLVVLGISDYRVVVGVPEIRWEGQTPVLELASTERFDETASDEDLPTWLAAHIPAAVGRRRATFQVCERCRETNPPEWMLDDDAICQSCAEQDGAVF